MIKRLLLFAALILGVNAAPLWAAQPPHLVFMIGEDEYHTWETLPEFAEKQLKVRGYRVTIVHADAADKNNFPGLVAALREADLLFVSVRRRTPRKEQLDAVRAHLAAGKPVIGIRTASHGFAALPKEKVTDPRLAVWPEFDPQVLGGHYTGHHRSDPKVKTETKVSAAPGAEGHAILKGFSADQLASTSVLYINTPLEKTATPLLIGTIPEKAPEPVAWTHTYGPKKARVFYTSLGGPEDFKNPAFRRLVVNSIGWALGK